MEYLAIVVLGEQSNKLTNELTNIIYQCDCNINECRMSNIGSEFSANVLVSGNWNAIAKLEGHLENLEQKFNIHIAFQRTQSKKYPPKFLPYIAYIVAQDQRGLVDELSHFCQQNSINIESLFVDTYQARQTGTGMVAITTAISISEAVPLAELRERFMLFCDRFNIDGVLEPDKG